jgi:hypothetical protein
VGIIESLIKVVDPSIEEARRADRERPEREAAAPPQYRCRVCGHLGPERSFCPTCLAETMEKAPRTP